MLAHKSWFEISPLNSLHIHENKLVLLIDDTQVLF